MDDSPPRIELQDWLKLERLVQSGGEAKVRIQGGDVRVNGEIETRRRKKLVDGDRVEIGGVESVVKVP